MNPLVLRSTRSRLVSAALLAAVTSGVLVATAASPSHAATPPAAKQLTDGFLDRSSGAYLRLQLDPTQPRYGAFVAALPGIGLIWPTGAADVQPRSGQDTQLRYNSSGYLDAKAQLDPEFGVAYQFTGTRTASTVRLVGHIDPAHHTGVVELWLNGTHYHLTAQGDPSRGTPADPTVAAVLAAYRAQDWHALYKLTDTSLTANQTEQQFTALLTNGLAGSHIGAAQTAGATSYTTTSTGIAFAQVPITLTQVDQQGTTQSTPVTLRLIYDTGGAWHMLTLA